MNINKALLKHFFKVDPDKQKEILKEKIEKNSLELRELTNKRDQLFNELREGMSEKDVHLLMEYKAEKEKELSTVCLQAFIEGSIDSKALVKDNLDHGNILN